MSRRYRRYERDWPGRHQWSSGRREDEYSGSRDWDRDNDQYEWNERYAGLGGRGWREGLDDAMHRGHGPFAGRGPRNYQRQDDRIEEDINERLTDHPNIDASDIEVVVQNGEVTLRGEVNRREEKWLAEDIAESVFGVKDINNQIRVRHRSWRDRCGEGPEQERRAG